MEIATPVGDGSLSFSATQVKRENQQSCAAGPNFPAAMPPELARESLADAARAACGLLELLAVSIASHEGGAAPCNATGGRGFIVATIRQAQYTLNEALSDAQL